MSRDEPRPTCLRCRRPASVCYCAACPRLETRTRIVILQHPRERDMAIGTARMASLCLPQSELHVGVRWDGSNALAKALSDRERPPILLYPGPGARDILREPPEGPVTLVVVDGTWSQAKTVVRDNPVLQALPRYAFTAPEPSRYEIRREPREEYVSTIEALMHVLGMLEQDPERFRGLLDPLHAMVRTQVAFRGRSPRHQRRRTGAARPRELPQELTTRFADLVCVVGEANAWPYRAGAARPPDELVHLVACRLASGESFDMVVAPEIGLAPGTVRHVELSEDRLRRGATRAELLGAFARFSRPTDVFLAWGYFGTNLLGACGAVLPRDLVDVRRAAKRLSKARIGSLEGYCEAIAPRPAPALGEGRAGRRLSSLVQVVRLWCEQEAAAEAALGS
jgi:DTW domain-containing protein YfiP